MEKLKRKEIIERLSRFRSRGDQLTEDLYNLSMAVLGIASELESKQNRTPEEEVIFEKLRGVTQQILKASTNADSYKKSMLKDYTSVIKNLSIGSEGID
ncbi:hypothetical protein QSZ85_000652 [Escherichia coli]|uniref:hypothetical protein n=1 Tax=Escherichia coli TaxID=562 RepID=UPI001850CA52|nr:hypothetical protein [Escherichia coli]EHJ7977362.1 hypothetical protein [Escherichia coli]EJF6664113.1 hypothetical protein [Escherichia coli]ELD0463206.1 hypothetical protein [Escherichia coli]ELD0488972.1 hypothetical protein [Escherichia coli]ELD0531229.1 hypothetical protein [Escherichia coli]